MKYYYKDLEINVPEGVYYPREDSELLAEAIEKIDVKNKGVLEIGCGSGLLSVIMAKCGANVTSVDVNEEAVEATKENANNNSVKVNAFASNMFENVKGRFDLILFNPPYLPIGEEDVDDISYSGGSSGREIIEIFLNDAPNYMLESGRLIIVISSLTDEHEVLSLIKEAGMSSTILKRKKIPWEELIVIEISCV